MTEIAGSPENNNPSKEFVVGDFVKVVEYEDDPWYGTVLQSGPKVRPYGAQLLEVRNIFTGATGEIGTIGDDYWIEKVKEPDFTDTLE